MWPGEQPGYAKDVALFEKAHPNISVTIEVIPYANYEPKLTEEFTTGGGPDVFWVNTPWVPTWAKDGAFENLAPLVQKSHINMSAYNSHLVSLYSRGSDIYALPKELNTVAFVYNKSYFAKEHLTAPTNWSWSPSNPGLVPAFPAGGDHGHERQQCSVGEVQRQVDSRVWGRRRQRRRVRLGQLPG